MHPIVLLIGALAGILGAKVYVDRKQKAVARPKCVGRVWHLKPQHPLPVGPDVLEPCQDPQSNKVMLGWKPDEPDSPYIVEGNKFEPLSLGSFDYSAIEADTLKETLAIPGNSVYGYIDYLMDVGGMDDAKEIATQIAKEAMADTDLHIWYKGPGAFGEADSFVFFVEEWRDSLAARISSYVAEAGGIPFEPGD